MAESDAADAQEEAERAARRAQAQQEAQRAAAILQQQRAAEQAKIVAAESQARMEREARDHRYRNSLDNPFAADTRQQIAEAEKAYPPGSPEEAVRNGAQAGLLEEKAVAALNACRAKYGWMAKSEADSDRWCAKEVADVQKYASYKVGWNTESLRRGAEETRRQNALAEAQRAREARLKQEAADRDAADAEAAAERHSLRNTVKSFINDTQEAITERVDEVKKSISCVKNPFDNQDCASVMKPKP